MAGVFPAKCEKCEGVGFWSTDPDNPLIEHRKHKKPPRVPFSVTHQDYKLFLKRIAVSKE